MDLSQVDGKKEYEIEEQIPLHDFEDKDVKVKKVREEIMKSFYLFFDMFLLLRMKIQKFHYFWKSSSFMFCGDLYKF